MKGFCFRCEHRARFLEVKARPRHECGNVDRAVAGCYMFRPVKPVVQEREAGDKRNILDGSMISARSVCLEVADVELRHEKVGKGMVLYWLPVEEKERVR